MKKIALDLDTLQVDSFDTTATPEMSARGTVDAHSLTTIGDFLKDAWSAFVC